MQAIIQGLALVALATALLWLWRTSRSLRGSLQEVTRLAEALEASYDPAPSTGNLTDRLLAAIEAQRTVENRRHSEELAALREQTSNLLAQAEKDKAFFRTIIDSANLYSFITIGMDGLVQDWNSGAQHIFGWTPASIVGQPVSKTFTKDDSPEAVGIQRERSTQVMKQGKAIFTMQRSRKNGELFPLHCTVTALKDENGKVKGFLEVGRDVTEEERKDREIQEQLQITRILDGITEYALTSISMDGRIRSWNSGAENIFGWDRVEALGRPISLTLPGGKTNGTAVAVRDAGHLSDRYDPVLSQGKAALKETRLRKGGAEFPVNCTITALRDEQGRVDGFVEICRDSTEAAKKDKEIRAWVSIAEELAQSLVKIEVFVKLIQDIAEQIQLVALNASIEACHAGERGKTFAVVAQKIKELALQTSEVSTRIQGQVVEFHSSAQKVTTALHTSGLAAPPS